jgi:hypothetical protein
MWKKNLTLENLLGLSVSLFCFALYYKTLCLTTDFIDSGELTTVAYTLGIAHPTGYPLFTLVGWVFSHFVAVGSVVFRMNLMAAVLCSAGLFIFYKFLNYFIAEILQIKISTDRFLASVPSILGTIALGLSGTFWSQATAVEVYSLHTVFLSTLLLIFTKAIGKGKRSQGFLPQGSSWLWQGFAFLLGLAFTNHMTTILLAPGFLFYYFYFYKFRTGSWMHLLRLAPAFIFGLSLYLYLPLRAGAHPLLDWGNPVELDRFWWHFTGKQYRVWIFSSSESAMKQLNYFLTTVSAKFAYVPVVLALIGIWNLIRHQRVIFTFTLLLFFGCILYAINYDIHDIDSYFLLAFYTIALWSAVGCAYLFEHLGDGKNKLAIGIGSIVVVTALMLTNYGEADESMSYLVEDYTRDMLNSVDTNAIIISYQWDYFVSAAYYFQIVENTRPDVVVIDKELLRRSWYYRQMQSRYPWLFSASRKEIEAFLTELYKFEHDLPYDPNLIEMKYKAVIRSFIEKNYSNRPVYATPEIEETYISGYSKVPSGLAFRLYKDSAYHPIKEPRFSFRMSNKGDQYVEGIVTQYARAYVNNSIYMHLGGRDDVALQLLDKAMEIRPGMPEALSLKESIMKKG